MECNLGLASSLFVEMHIHKLCAFLKGNIFLLELTGFEKLEKILKLQLQELITTPQA